MRPEITDWIKIPVRGGVVRFALYKTWDETWHDVGGRLVPSPIVLELREPDAPAIDLTIEVVASVPRVVDLHIWRYGAGREIRKKDLALNIEDLVEHAVAIASARFIEGNAYRAPLGFAMPEQDAELRRAVRAVQHARGRSQRQLTDERLQQIAAIYAAQEAGGIEAVAEVYNVHRATAARWIAKARSAGALPPRAGED